MNIKNTVYNTYTSLPESCRETIHTYYNKVVILFSKVRWYLFGKRIKNYKRIPIIINNYNRLTYLKLLIDSLTLRGYENIYILDNKSTYPPLMEYYKHCPHTVIYLKDNLGYKALWKSDIYNKFKNSYYVYTDSDMEIPKECPENFLQHFLDILNKYPMAQKVGFSIEIDDLPDHFINKDKVIEHESSFWKKEVEPGVYRAQIDTTFALYRPYCKGEADIFHEVYRTGKPYTIKHLPWYVDTHNMSEEELYYVNSINQSTHWTIISKNETK